MFLEPYSSEISSVEMIDDCSTRTDSNPQRDTNVASLSCATAATAADEDIDSQVTEVRQSATIADSSCSSSKIAIIEFINEVRNLLTIVNIIQPQHDDRIM